MRKYKPAREDHMRDTLDRLDAWDARVGRVLCPPGELCLRLEGRYPGPYRGQNYWRALVGHRVRVTLTLLD